MAKATTKSTKPFVKGGSTKMFGTQEANPQAPGHSGHATSGGQKNFASGGSGKMFGFAGSMPAKPGTSSAR